MGNNWGEVKTVSHMTCQLSQEGDAKRKKPKVLAGTVLSQGRNSAHAHECLRHYGIFILWITMQTKQGGKYW